MITEYEKTFVIDAKTKQGRYIDFVRRAVSTDETRNAINDMYCNGNFLYGTDGKRLHFINIKNIDADHVFKYDMRYAVISSKKSQMILTEKENTGDNTYPPVSRVFPDGTPEIEFEFNGMESNMYKASINLIDFIRRVKDTYFNIDFLMQLEKPIDGSKWTVSWYGNKKAILFTNNNQGGLIMPMAVW